MKSNEVQVEYCTFHYCQDEQATVVSTGRSGSGGGGNFVSASPQKAPKQNFRVKSERQDNHCTNNNNNNNLNSNVEMTPPTVTVIPIPLLTEIQQQQGGMNLLQKNLDAGNHAQIAGQQQASSSHRSVPTTLNFCWTDMNNFKAFDSQASLPGKELKVGDQQSQNAVPPSQQQLQQIVMPILTPSSSGGIVQQPSTSTSSSQSQPTKLVALSGPGGATAYISSVDVGTLYGYELVDQGKIVCRGDDPSSSLTYTTTTGEPVSLFVTGAANQITIPNMNMDPQQQIQIQIQQQQQHQQQTNRSQRQVVSTDNNGHKSHNMPGTSSQHQQQQQNSVFLKETIEYLDCASQNLKLYTNLNLNDGKKLELLKTIHARSMELFNLTMWINEDERLKRAHAFPAPDESQFGRKSQGFANFDGYEQKSIIPNAVQQHQPVQSNTDQSDDDKFVKVTVVSPQNAGHVDEVRFRIRLTTELGKLKKAYAERLGLPVYTLRFVYRNRVIKDEETPQMLKMEAEDVVQVYAEQVS